MNRPNCHSRLWTEQRFDDWARATELDTVAVAVAVAVAHFFAYIPAAAGFRTDRPTGFESPVGTERRSAGAAAACRVCHRLTVTSGLLGGGAWWVAAAALRRRRAGRHE